MSENVTELKDADFDKLVVQGALPAVVDFWAVWCGPCKALSPAVEQVAGEYTGKVNFFKCNIEESPQAPSRYGIRSIPTLLFFKDGKVIDQVVGLVPAAKIQSSVKKLL
ncbi:MAG: thioredoxin [Deltaproteobacteria bacterium]|nr:thioredoxin [Deltaproteobacteria bacterium]